MSRGGAKLNISGALESGRVELVVGDVRDVDAVDKAVAGKDAIFHLAAIRITRCALEPRLANDILVNGTFNVLEAAANHGVSKVIASSSASVYGLADEFPTTESQHPYNNDTIYGAAKAYNEAMLRSFHAMYALDYLALRYFNVYGPRMDTEGKYTEVMIRWMEAIAKGLPPVIHGDGSTTMDFVYVGDIARANIAALRSDVTDEVFNIATGIETSLLDLANALIEVMGVDVTPQFEEARSVGGVTRRRASTAKAQSMLGYSPETNLHTGLQKLVEWWKASALATLGQ